MRTLPLDFRLDLAKTVGHLCSGRYDPTQRLRHDRWVRATRTPEGPALIDIQLESDRVRAEAFGAGGDWLLERLPDLVGLNDVPPALAAAHPELEGLEKRAVGHRLPRTHAVVEMLTVIVLQQLVSGPESKRAYARLSKRHGEPAPHEPGLSLPLHAEQLAGLAPAEFIPLGITPRQGETLRQVGRRARRLEEAIDFEADAAEDRLRAIPGVGIWSARSAMLRGLGHPDAVILGDYNLPNGVARFFAGEEQADDARMLELLEPYRGQRGRVLRWLDAHPRAQRRAPRAALRPIPDDARRFGF